MKRLSSLLVMAGAAIVFSVPTGQLLAQAPPGGGGRGNFDPEQIRKAMLERMKERFEVTNDDEWKLISARIEKVSELRREAGGFTAGFGRPPGRPGGGGDQAAGQQGGDRSRTRTRFGGPPSPDVEALQKAIEAKASNEELKAKMEKLRASRKAKEAELEKAQDELRQILNVRQEAIALEIGLLK